MTFAIKLLLSAAACVALSSELGWASESCHIHPPGSDPKEPEYRSLQFYNSLEECELAKAKYFGGAGRCHCFPDFMNREKGDIWSQPPRDFERPQNKSLY
jgi:hypothetical protein